ncbi:MAG: CPBP family intramembrane glutamic endopeptidase, partial [Bacteroidales bacterium]
MIYNHLIRYSKNYFLILFVSFSFILSLIFNKTGQQFYYILAAILIILGFTKYSFSVELRSAYKLLKNKAFYIYQLPVMFISNIILIVILKDYLIGEIQQSDSEPMYVYLLSFFFFNSIRIFGEEFIFRAFLLMNEIKRNNFLFWTLNILQAFLFSIVHYFIAQELTNILVFTMYVFITALYFGWINRKFDSLFASWTIHWMNGLQTLIMAAI